MKPTIKISDLATGETVEREMNSAELAQREIDQQVAMQLEAEVEAKALAKALLFNRLGITEEEARLLLGGN